MLSIVATPIGNLGDITLRAIEILKTCDAIICEDTRVTGNLLLQLKLPKKELINFHSHSHEKSFEKILERLSHGEHLALVSDAGTPCISDPGYRIISNIPHTIPVQTIPGPSAFLAALSVSGLPINHFIYFGFLPIKKGRQTLLASFRNREETIVFYESVHRIEHTLRELANLLHDQPHRPVVICRELTKIYEEVIRTTISDLPIVAKTLMKKGEFVIVIGGA